MGARPRRGQQHPSPSPSTGSTPLRPRAPGSSSISRAAPTPPPSVDHHVRVEVNGAPVADETFDGAVPHRVEAELPLSLLRTATPNDLRVLNVGDTGVSSRVFLDRFEVAYPQTSAARSGVFEGRFPSSGTAEVTGLASPAALLDLTAASWLTAYEAGSRPALPRRGRSTATSPSPRRLCSLPASSSPSPPLVCAAPRTRPTTSSSLPRPSSPPPSPSSTAGPHRDCPPSPPRSRRSPPPSAQGSPPPRPSATSSPSPTTAGPGPRPATSSSSATPTTTPGTSTPPPRPRRCPTSSRRPPTSGPPPTPTLAALNGDDLLPDLAIGRLPATTLAQAQTLVAKILDWEDQGHSFDGNVALVADNPDLAGDFDADVRDIQASFFAGRDVTLHPLRPDRKPRHRTRPDPRRLQPGLSLISYVGHGGGILWATENMLGLLETPSPSSPSPDSPSCSP